MIFYRRKNTPFNLEGRFPGVHAALDQRQSISNLAVKQSRNNNTWGGAPREDSLMPGHNKVVEITFIKNYFSHEICYFF